MKPFLILQLRPIDEAADNEFESICKYGELAPGEVHRVRMEVEGIPEIDLEDYAGVIVGGGPSNVSDPEDKKEAYQIRFEADLNRLLPEILERDFPYLGTCYGLGILARYCGGVVSKEKYYEDVGHVELFRQPADDPLLNGLPQRFDAFAGHKEACQNITEGMVILLSSVNCPIHMVRLKENIYATQFHTELDQEGIELRINVYKHHGYFEPHKADELIEKNSKIKVTVPMEILRRFVKRYQRS